MPTPSYSRRHFLRQILSAGALATTGLESLSARTSGALATTAEPFRFAFVTDIHLMPNPSMHAVAGLTACLTAVENLNPRPEFILVGGDLVNGSPDMTIPEAEKNLALFLKVWSDHTALPARWVFGNHDLVGTSNPAASAQDRFYGKGLFRDRFELPQLFYSFDYKGWHFVVLDDIGVNGSLYTGKIFDDELSYLRADLTAHRSSPTILCSHIPLASNAPMALHLAKAIGLELHGPHVVVCENTSALFSDLPTHNIRAVLSGHLHYYETLSRGGIQYITSGAVCGNYWRGPVLGCPEGFGVVDVGPNGSVDFDYASYGWKAS